MISTKTIKPANTAKISIVKRLHRNLLNLPQFKTFGAQATALKTVSNVF